MTRSNTLHRRCDQFVAEVLLNAGPAGFADNRPLPPAPAAVPFAGQILGDLRHCPSESRALQANDPRAATLAADSALQGSFRNCSNQNFPAPLQAQSVWLAPD